MRIDISRLFLTYRDGLAALGLIFLAFITYSNIYTNHFFFDDESLIIRNQFLRSWDSLPQIFSTSTLGGAGLSGVFYRPLQILAYVFIYQFSEVSPLSPTGFHAWNVGLHAANAVLMFMLGLRLGWGRMPVLLAAMIWTVHPLQTEAIAYMSGSADPMYLFFMLLGIVALLPSFSWRRVIFACCAFLCSVLSKESAVMMPALVTLVWAYWRYCQREFIPFIRIVPLWAITGLFLVFRFTFLNFNGTDFFNADANFHTYYVSDVFVRLWTCLATLPHYAALIIVPHDLRLERYFPIVLTPFTPFVFGGGALVMAAFMLVHRAIRQPIGQPFAFGVLWGAFVHAPQTGLLIPVNAVFLEHWMYVPLVGVFLGAAQTVFLATESWLPLWRKGLVVIMSVIVVAFMVISLRQNTLWRDSITFHQHILDLGEPSVRAYNNLGRAYYERGDFEKGIEILERSIAMNDIAAEVRVNLGYGYTFKKEGPDIDKARQHLLRALEIDKNVYVAYAGLAYLAYLEGKEDEARRYHETAQALQNYYQAKKGGPHE